MGSLIVRQTAIGLFIFAAATLVLSFLAVSPAQAKDLTSRLGVGYKNQFSEELPSIAVQYYPSANLGLSAALGVDTKDDDSRFGFMVKLYRIIFMEDNMNFYMGSGIGVISLEELNSKGKSENESGFELNGYVGGEFFLPGLDSLGFSFEAGIGVTSISSEVRFRTIGDHPLKAGVTFYF